jgi:hypothetical protein
MSSYECEPKLEHKFTGKKVPNSFKKYQKVIFEMVAGVGLNCRLNFSLLAGYL